LPRAHFHVGSKRDRIRYAVIGGAALVLVLLFAIVVRRIAAPSRAPLRGGGPFGRGSAGRAAS